MLVAISAHCAKLLWELNRAHARYYKTNTVLEIELQETEKLFLSIQPYVGHFTPNFSLVSLVGQIFQTASHQPVDLIFGLGIKTEPFRAKNLMAD